MKFWTLRREIFIFYLLSCCATGFPYNTALYGKTPHVTTIPNEVNRSTMEQLVEECTEENTQDFMSIGLHDEVTTPNEDITSLGPMNSTFTDVINSTNTELRARGQHYSDTILLLFMILAITCIVGIIGNIFAVIILQGSKMRKLDGNIFLTALSLCDGALLLALFVTKYLPSWVDNITYFLAFLSKYIMITMTIARFFAVRFPLKSKIILTQERYLGSLLIGCVVIALPVFMLDLDKFETIGAFSKLIGNFIGGIIILLFNIGIIIQLVISSRRRQKYTNGQENTDKKNSATTMLLVVSFSYLIMSTPFHIMEVLDALMGILPQYLTLHLIMANIAFASHALNFLFFWIGGKIFRDETQAFFSKIWHCLHRKKKTGDPQTGPTSLPTTSDISP